MKIGLVIKTERERQGRSQQDVATKAGLAVGTLATIEQRERNPRFDTIRKIARSLGVSLSTLAARCDDI